MNFWSCGGSCSLSNLLLMVRRIDRNPDFFSSFNAALMSKLALGSDDIAVTLVAMRSAAANKTASVKFPFCGTETGWIDEATERSGAKTSGTMLAVID